jgi:hypothetical protein
MLKIILRILYIPVSVLSASILLQITEVINTPYPRSTRKNALNRLFNLLTETGQRSF